MKVRLVRGLERAAEALAGRPSAVAIGNFDGVHRGHLALAARAARASAPEAALALTFDPHPARYFRPEAAPLELTSIEERARLLGIAGIELVVALEFGAALAALAPRAFAEEVLRAGLGARRIIVGADFRFGRDRAGDPEALAGWGFEVEAVEPIKWAGEPVSSTRVREAVRSGELGRAHDLLSRPFAVCGTVVGGDARGRALGFPTANVAPEAAALPPDGIYASTLHAPHFGALPSVTYIGRRPTYYESAGAERTIETYALGRGEADEPLAIYGQRVRVDLHVWLRPDRAFEEERDLVAQIGRDVRRAEAWHGLL